MTKETVHLKQPIGQHSRVGFAVRVSDLGFRLVIGCLRARLVNALVNASLRS